MDAIARRLNGTTDFVAVTAGAFSGAGNQFTYGTMAAIVRRNSIGNWHAVVQATNAGTPTDQGFELATGDQVYHSVGGVTSTSTFTSTTTWYLLVVTKATGTATPRFHFYNYTSTTWTHEDFSGTAGDSGSAITAFDLGQYPGGDRWDGDIAAIGMYRAWNPNDAAVEAAGLHTAATNWVAAAANSDLEAVWLFNQASAATQLVDATGGGANETSSGIGTVVAGPAGYTEDLSALVVVPAWKANGTAQESVTTITVPWPTHVAGDVGLLLCESCGGEPTTLTTANGFVAVTGSPSATGTTTLGTTVNAYWCRATSGAMASPVVGDPGNHVYGVIVTFTGCVTTGDPWNVTAAAVKASASTSMSMPAVTTTVKNCLIVNTAARDNDLAAAAGSAEANASLTGLAERFDAGTALGNGGGLMVWTGTLATPGSSGNTTATVTSSINAYLTIALKPPPLAPPPPRRRGIHPALLAR